MKFIAVYITIISILIQSMNFAAIYVTFKINQNYIIEVLCINRDKPEMKCHGQCQLTKRIKEEEKKEREKPVNNNEKNITYFPGNIYAWLFIPRNIDTKQYPKLIILLIPLSFITEVFHPPKRPSVK